MTKEAYVFLLNKNFFMKRELKKNEKIANRSTKYFEFYPHYIKYINLASDCYKIVSLVNGLIDISF